MWDLILYLIVSLIILIPLLIVKIKFYKNIINYPIILEKYLREKYKI